MNNNQLTYLRALGITPWQRNATFKLPSENRHAKRLMIMTDQEQNGHSESLLNNMLRAIDIDRRETLITTMSTLPDLEKLIALHQPSLLLAMGQTVAEHLLNVTTPLNELRERIHTFGALQTPVIVTYHPGHLLHQPGDKRHAYLDWQYVVQTLSAI